MLLLVQVFSLIMRFHYPGVFTFRYFQRSGVSTDQVGVFNDQPFLLNPLFFVVEVSSLIGRKLLPPKMLPLWFP